MKWVSRVPCRDRAPMIYLGEGSGGEGVGSRTTTDNGSVASRHAIRQT